MCIRDSPNYHLEREYLAIQVPGEIFYLSHGRSKAIELKKAALQKRRQSIITISSGPTDLTKCFSKSKVSLSISTEVDGDLDEEIDIDISGYSPRTVRKSAVIFSSPKLNRSSNYLSKTSMLLLQMNEEMIPEIRRREIIKYQQSKLMISDEKSIEKKKYAQHVSSKEMKSTSEKHELIKEAQKYEGNEQNKNQLAVENQKMLETKKLFFERGLKLERSSEKAENTKNAAKEYRDALAEHKKKLAARASFWGV